MSNLSQIHVRNTSESNNTIVFPKNQNRFSMAQDSNFSQRNRFQGNSPVSSFISPDVPVLNSFEILQDIDPDLQEFDNLSSDIFDNNCKFQAICRARSLKKDVKLFLKKEIAHY